MCDTTGLGVLLPEEENTSILISLAQVCTHQFSVLHPTGKLLVGALFVLWLGITTGYCVREGGRFWVVSDLIHWVMAYKVLGWDLRHVTNVFDTAFDTQVMSTLGASVCAVGAALTRQHWNRGLRHPHQGNRTSRERVVHRSSSSRPQLLIGPSGSSCSRQPSRIDIELLDRHDAV